MEGAVFVCLFILFYFIFTGIDTYSGYEFVVSACAVQFSLSVVSATLWPHGLQHTRPSCPSQLPGVYSNSCPLNNLLGFFLVAQMVKNLSLPETDYPAGDLGSIPGLGGSPGEGNGNPLQYSCVENSMDRGGWWAIVHRIAKSQTWLSN